MTIEHSAIPNAGLHEPKGADSAGSGEVYIADGLGSGAWSQPGNLVMGTWLYEDNATAGAPIALTLAATDYEMTNDGAGSNTVDYPSLYVTDPWDTATDRLDFTGLALGDSLDIRFTFQAVTSGANHAITLSVEFGLGSGNEFTIPLVTQRNFKAAGTHQITDTMSIFMGSSTVLDYPARILAQSDNTGDTMIVDEFFIRVIQKIQ